MSTITKKRLSSAAGCLNHADRRTLDLLRHGGHWPWLQNTMVRLAAAAEDGGLWLALGSTLAVVDRGRRRRWLVAGATGPLGILANYPLKRLFRRVRPQLDVERLGDAPSELSFPSAHATSSVAAATVMFRVAPRWRILPVGLAALVGIGRPYLGMHHPSDVLGGWVYGFLVGSGVNWMMKTRRLAGVIG